MVRVRSRYRQSRKAGGFGVGMGMLGLCGLFAMPFLDIQSLQIADEGASAPVRLAVLHPPLHPPLPAASSADIDTWFAPASHLGRFSAGSSAQIAPPGLRGAQPVEMASAPASEPLLEPGRDAAMEPQQTAALAASAPLPPQRPAGLGQRTFAQRSVEPGPASPAAPQSEQGFSISRIFGGILKPSEPQEGAPSVLAYAPTERSLPNALPNASPAVPGGMVLPSASEKTAVYDISARMVYMPNGERLEAHSGLGQFMDDPRHVHRRMKGATPPNVYNLELRKGLFHGVQAVRMLPTDQRRMFGRDGILVHTYMLGPRGDSNGCVSLANYNAFLQAFMRGEVRRMIVIDGSTTRLAQR